MIILFCARPAHGHVYPLIPVAQAARTAGHDVHFATGGPFVERLRQLGIAAHDVGVSIEDGLRQLRTELSVERAPTRTDGRPDLAAGARLFIEILGRGTAADLSVLLSSITPDVVVYEQYDLGAAVAAHAAGIPVVCHSISPLLDEALLGATGAAELLERLWADYGVTSPELDLLGGDALIDIFPVAMQPPSVGRHPDRLRLRPGSFVEPGLTTPGWLGRSGRPLVYLTLGTIVATDHVLRPVIDGLARLDADVLVALGSASGAELGALAPNVHVERFVDQPAALRAADLAVHHGGSGTLLGALLAGTPQVLLPQGTDQFFNADLALTADLAAALEPASVSAATVAQAAESELGRLRPAAGRAQAELRSLPDADEVVAQLAARFGSRVTGTVCV